MGDLHWLGGQPLGPTRPPTLCGTGNEYWPSGSGTSHASQTVLYISTYGLDDLRKEDEHPVRSMALFLVFPQDQGTIQFLYMESSH